MSEVRRRRSPVATFGIAAAALVAGLWYGAQARDRALPSNLQYIPAEHEVIQAFGDHRSLWRMIEHHLGPSMRGTADAGAFETNLRAQAERLRRHDIVLSGPEDLARCGIDPGGFALASGTSSANELFVIGISDQTAFQRFLSAQLERAPSTVSVPLARGAVRLPQFGEYTVAFPEANVAVLATSPETLARALDHTTANLRRFRTSDAFYGGVRQFGRGPLGAGPSVYMFASPSEIPLIRDMSGAATLYDDRGEANLQLRLRTGRLRFLEGIFAPAPARVAWRRLLPADTAAALVFEDRQLARYLDVIGSSTSGEAIRQHYGGVLWELRRARNLERIVIAVTGYRAGLPELALGVWAEPASMRQILQDVQRRLRRARQDEILAAATAAAGPGGTPALDPESIGPEADERLHGTTRLMFLLPPVTSNDLKYRRAFQGVDPALAATDRYRLAAAEAHGAWWITTDTGALTAIIDGFEPSRSFADSRAGGAADLAGRTGDKFQLMIDMDQVTRLGMLSPETGVDEAVRRYLVEFRDHPLITMRAWPVSSDTARASFRIVRREAAR